MRKNGDEGEDWVLKIEGLIEVVRVSEARIDYGDGDGSGSGVGDQWRGGGVLNLIH